MNPVSGGIDAEVTELQGLEGTVPFGDPTTAGNADKRPACGNPSPAPGVLFGKEPTRHLQKTMLCVMKAVGIAVSGPSGPSDAVVQGLRGLMATWWARARLVQNPLTCPSMHFSPALAGRGRKYPEAPDKLHPRS